MGLLTGRWSQVALSAVSIVAVASSLSLARASGVASAGTLAVPGTTPTSTVTVGSNPIDVAISKPLAEAFVANDGSVSVVGLNNHQVVASVGTGFHDQEAIAMVRNGTEAYIGTFDLPYVTVMEAVRRAVTGRVKVGLGAVSIAVAHPSAGERAYVALLTASKLAVIRTSDGVVVADVKLPRGPQTVTTTPGGQNEWVGSSYEGTIWVVSTTSPKIRRTISIPQAGPVVSIAFSPNGRYAWVSGLGGVAVVSRARGLRSSSFPSLRSFRTIPISTWVRFG